MPSEEEGMPNALLEAMAAGVPFVASDVAAVREMTPPMTHEFVLPYGDINQFSEKIEKLLADEELRKRISTEEQEWVGRYDVSIIARKFLELLKEDETGLYCNLVDSRDLANKILKLKNNPELLNTIAENGYKLFNENLTSKHLAEVVLSHLKQTKLI